MRVIKAFDIYREYGILPLIDRAFEQFTDIKFLSKSYYATKIRKQSPITYQGVTLSIDDDIFSDEILRRFYWSTYEQHEREALASYLNGYESLIDLGSCTGFLSAYAESKQPDIKTVAVEANPDLIPIISETKSLNEAEMKIVNAAYDPIKQSVTFHQDSLVVGGSVQRETDTKVEISAISLSELIEEHKLSHPVIVCDIEGGEVGLLQQELDVLENQCPLLIIELHNFADGIEEAESVLQKSSLEKIDEYKINNPNSIKVYNNPDLE